MSVRRRAAAYEIAGNALAVVVVPLLAHLLASPLAGPARSAGVGRAWTLLSSAGEQTDIGMAVISAHGLVSPDHTPYDAAAAMDVLGMGAYDAYAHTHPPTSVVLWAVLLLFDYRIWLPAWMVLSACAIAGSMRLLQVPASIAYPVAAGICLTAPGAESLATTYPLTALALAAAWRYRDRAVAGGIAFGLVAAERGIGGLLLIAPALRRRWRVVGVALLVLVLLLGAALALEPTVVGSFLTQGRDAVAAYYPRPDMLSPFGVLWRHGWPVWLVWVAAAAWSVACWRRGSDVFWVLVWATAVASPLAWPYSSIGLLPLAVVVWQSGAAGRAVTIVTGFAVFGLLPLSPITPSLGWPAALAGLGIGLLVAPVGATTAHAAPIGR